MDHIPKRRLMTARFSSITKFGVLSAASILAVTSGVRANELFSESVQVPPLKTAFGAPVTGWNKFHMLISNSILFPAQNATDTNTDPFAVNGTSTITTGANFVPLDSDAVEPI